MNDSYISGKPMKKSSDTMIDTSIEPETKTKVDKLINKSDKSSYIGKKVKVKVNDGNLFYGIVKGTDKKSIFLITSFGEITVNKKNILNISISK